MIRVFVIDPRQSTGSSAFVDAVLGAATGDTSKIEVPPSSAQNSSAAPDSAKNPNKDSAEPRS